MHPPFSDPRSPVPMPCSGEPPTAGELLLRAAAMVPVAHYLLAAALLLLVLLYNFFEFHLLRDIRRGLRGDPVALTFHPASKIYDGVAAKCRALHGRYLATPWLASPHFQTTFLNFSGNPPVFTYRRQLFHVQDGGTIALDWLLACDVAGGSSDSSRKITKEDTTPIVVVIPGLTSDSAAAYLKHLAYMMAKQGWNVVISNHRGLAGISITSDCFYNAGWTEDTREVVNYLHREYPKAHLFAVGTSIGANILVKYLGEDGEITPIVGAASVCSPWDLVICDRFITRKPIQRLYDRALAIGLKGYAQLHQPVLARLANWEGIIKSLSIRDFDHHATCHVGKFETVDTYYRCCSSVNFVRNVAVPLLCISALDDPLCTREAIPWDECRANKNIILATTEHGGHLAFFKGLAGNRLWWVEAVHEFLSILGSSPFMHGQKLVNQHTLPTPSIDKGPYVNVTEAGMVAAAVTRAAENDNDSNGLQGDGITSDLEPDHVTKLTDKMDHITEAENEAIHDHQPVEVDNAKKESYAKVIHEATTPIKKSINQLSRKYGVSMWLLAYIAIVTSWPFLGGALSIMFRRKSQKKA